MRGGAPCPSCPGNLRPGLRTGQGSWMWSLILAGALSGCGLPGEVTRVEEKGINAPDHITPGETITIVGLPGVEDETVECIHTEIRTMMPGAQVMPALTFRDQMFPWFEPNLAPRDTKSLAKLMGRTKVKERVVELQVRYVVTVVGSTVSHRNLTGWGGIYGAGYGGGGVVIGGLGTDEKTVLNASILDMKKIQSVGTIEATAEGRTEVGIIVMVPYLYSVSSMKGACKTIAERVAGYVTEPPDAPAGQSLDER